ncbi:MAG: stage 0 sporulation family protein [Anaerolineae bacterium]|nr:MAG: stage 0 sporulation family protein [Anaerolineae bacterium]
MEQTPTQTVPQTETPFIVGIRFHRIGKIYHFDASGFRDLQPGEFVIVKTRRGRQLGEVVKTFPDAPPEPPRDSTWVPVERRATPRDLVLRQIWQKKELEVTIACRDKAHELGLRDVKIVASEFSFDGALLTILYSTESGNKVNLNALQKAMQRLYPKASVEMRQIGPRDVAKILGGMGACGIESRCCSTFLTEFSPVSIKMAKAQGISLSPSEITGMCGRLRCCLVYEYEQYAEARKTLPKRKKRVVTPMGEGKVVDVFPLKQSVIVQLFESGERHEFLKHELQPWDELEALRRKAEAPCDRHENGECDCGKAAPAQNADSTPEEQHPPETSAPDSPIAAASPQEESTSDTAETAQRENRPRRASRRRRSRRKSRRS